MEEDLIFPAGRIASRPQLPTFNETTESLPLSRVDSNVHYNALTSASATSVVTNGRSTKSVKSNARKSVRILVPPEEVPPLPSFHDLSSPTYSSAPPSTLSFHPLPHPDFEMLLNPQDHSKLKQAWNNMLLNRFLGSRVISVLQLYLSSEFGNVQTHPPIHIPLPPNSDSTVPSQPPEFHHLISHLPIPTVTLENDDPGVYVDLRSQSVRQSSDSRNGDCLSNLSKQSRPMVVHSWSSMHLARTVSLIEGCKDAIWEEYKKVDGEFNASGVEAVNTWYEFDVAWSNWHKYMSSLFFTSIETGIANSLFLFIAIWQIESP